MDLTLASVRENPADTHYYKTCVELKSSVTAESNHPLSAITTCSSTRTVVRRDNHDPTQGHESEKICSPLNVGVIVLQFVIVASPFGQDLLDIDT